MKTPKPMPRPFSGPKYSEHADRDDTSTHAGPCAVCGRPVRKDKPHKWAEVVDGGASFANPGTGDSSDPGYMGLFPVGPECAKRFPAEMLTESSL